MQTAAIMSLSHHPRTTIHLLLSLPSHSPPTLDFQFVDENYPLTCPYDSTRHTRQCARLMDDSKRRSKAASTTVITVKAIAPIKRFSLQSGSQTSRSSPQDDQPPSTQTQPQEPDSMPRLPSPVTFLPLCIRRSY